jgi:hypothetical protein
LYVGGGELPPHDPIVGVSLAFGDAAGVPLDLRRSLRDRSRHIEHTVLNTS